MAADIGLTFDKKQNRIRIFRSTFKLMGYPDYIQLLFSPEQQAFVIKACDKDIPDAIKINKFFNGSVPSSVELHSKLLIFRICSAVNGAFDNLNYCKLSGTVYAEEGIAVFPLSTLVGR